MPVQGSDVTDNSSGLSLDGIVIVATLMPCPAVLANHRGAANQGGACRPQYERSRKT